MRELDRAGADRQQAAGRSSTRATSAAASSLARLELGERDPPALDGARGALGGEPQQHAARDGLLRPASSCAEGVLGEPRDRAAHAAGALVGGEPQAPPVAPLPELEQRGREQRQRARLALDVGHQRVGQLGLDAQAGALRRALDRAAQLVAAHRADEHVIRGEQAATAPGTSAQRP